MAYEVKRRDRDRPDAVTLVANDVGGIGGMERQTARLVEGLLEAEWTVTVIARNCTVRPRPGLQFVRVRGPRRPFTLAYPVFALLATLHAARRGDALLHTTGAIVANRADVSSVHYCHSAARVALNLSRSSRASGAYRLNATIAAMFAAAGEAWCYRPCRTSLLCPVSHGVGRELSTHFPRMAHTVRTVANGVDTSEFKPDPRARAEVRGRLGLPDGAGLALFVGGDWQRKGLTHAVEALRLAPSWHLAVAGEGQRSTLRTLAIAAGTDRRLHFLGRVATMAELYAGADAFVFPTAYEAFPLAMLEAAAAGIPLLVTRVSGAEDLVQDGRNGWFIAANAADIARRLNELTDDAGLARRLGANARAAAGRYSWSSMIDGYLAAYAELLR